MSDTYTIVASFRGAGAIVNDFRRIKNEAERNRRAIVEGARAESSAIAEARRREREATREVARAQREAMQSQRRMFQEQKRLRAEDIQSQRQHIERLKRDEQSYQQTRNRSLKMIGVGTAGLIGLGAGIKEAGSFEDALVDLRTSITRFGEDGSTNMALLNSQMKEFETLAVKLGNSLPGSTEGFTRLFISLRQGGLSAEQILGGAGEAAAHLAVVTKSVPEDMGKVFAQLGVMSQIKPEDYGKAAELLSRLHTTIGVKPEQIIEGAKYSIPRGGLPLGLKGYRGLEANLKLLGLMERGGLSGSVGGEAIANLMTRLTFDTKGQQKKLAELRGKGIDLKFFDKKGGFLGEENMIGQFEKLKGLSPEEKSSTLHKLFGERGKPAADALADIGVKGYRDFAAELNGVLSVEQKLTAEMEKLNTKVENLIGTFQNLVATTFSPMAESLKPALDVSNRLIGSVQGWAKDHPGVAKFSTHLIAIGSTALILTGSFKTMTSAYRMWKLATRIGASEGALLGFLKQTRTEAVSTGAVLESTGKKATGFRGAIGRIPSSVKTTIGLVGIDIAMGQVSKLLEEMEKLKQAQDDLNETGGGVDKAYELYKKTLAKQGKLPEEKVVKGQSDAVRAALNSGDDLRKALVGMPYESLLNRAYGSKMGNPWEASEAENTIRQRAPVLKHPEVMKSFIEQVRGGWLNLPKDKQDQLINVLGKAFPDSFKKASDMVGGQFVPSALKATAAFEDVAARLRGLDINIPIPGQGGQGGPAQGPTKGGRPNGPVNQNYTPPKPSFPFTRGPFSLQRDSGPSLPYDNLSNYTAGGGGGVHLNYSPVVSIPGGSPEQQVKFGEMLALHKREILDILAQETADIELGF
jgi:TP901 family phage tail tape measure protein